MGDGALLLAELKAFSWLDTEMVRERANWSCLLAGEMQITAILLLCDSQFQSSPRPDPSPSPRLQEGCGV